MNAYETLLHDHVKPFLEDSEKIECAGYVTSGFWRVRHFIIGVTSRRIVLVEVQSNWLGPKPTFKEVRQIPFESVAWLITSSGQIRIELHSGEICQFKLNTLSRKVPGQRNFIKTMKQLYFQYEEESEALPEQSLERPTIQPTLTEDTNVQVEVNQNLGMGILGGTVAAVIGAVIWAAITYFTEYQISYMALGVGLLVGLTVHLIGRGTGREYGIVAAVLSFAGCVLGNILAIISIAADVWEVTWLEALKVVYYLPEMLKEIMIDNIDVTDIFFYVVAIYVGYKMAYGTGEKKKKVARPSVYS